MAERKYLYQVSIEKLGSCSLLAVDKHEAVEIAYSRYQHLQSDRKKYTAKKRKI
jgi:hypothetical protein